MITGTGSVSVSAAMLSAAVRAATAQWNSRRRPALLDLSGRTDARELARIAGELGKRPAPVGETSHRADEHWLAYQLARTSPALCRAFVAR